MEGNKIVGYAAYLIGNLVTTFDTGFQKLQDFDGPVDKGDAAVVHAFLKLVDQLF